MRFEPADGARFTFFHVLWFALTIASAVAAWWCARPLGGWWSAAIAIGTLIIAVPGMLGREWADAGKPRPDREAQP